MSFFDGYFTLESEYTNKQEFLKKVVNNQLGNFQIDFSCPIIYWNNRGIPVFAIAKLIDAKFVIFKVLFSTFFFFLTICSLKMPVIKMKIFLIKRKTTQKNI